MIQRFCKIRLLLLPLAACVCLGLTSCREDYILDEEEPTWLGSSIYEYLVDEGCYTHFVQLIDDLEYGDVLKKTGSKTLFVVDDETFDRFLADNEWGVRSYDELSPAQKRLLLNSNMLNNVYFSNMLGRIEGLEEQDCQGKCLRRTTALDVQDSVAWATPETMPETPFWDKARAKGGIRLLKDNTAAPMLHFTNKFMADHNITEHDFAILHNGQSRANRDEVWVNGVRVASPNNKCKNGVVHRLEELRVPPVNMAEAVGKDADSKTFARLLDRFCAPYYNAEATRDYQRLNPGSTDSVFVKRYFAERGENNQEYTATPADTLAWGILAFDPGWNSYTADSRTDKERDMAVMFVPTDEVMEQYWNKGGSFLRDRYGSWDNVPDDVLDDLVINHMKESFVLSVPSKFYQVKNDGQVEMGVKEEDIVRVELCCNGVVYFTKHVYPPVSYISVSAPTVVNDNMRVARWAISELGFDAYLLSQDSYYSFILPTDDAFAHYLDPLSVAQGEPEEMEFYFDTKTHKVAANIYEYDMENHERGAYKRQLTPGSEVVKDRLEDIMDYHIIVDTLDNARGGKYFYRTKGNGTVVAQVSGNDFTLWGGWQKEEGRPVAVPESEIHDFTVEGNGKTYVTDQLLQQPMNSAYAAIQARAGSDDAPGPFYEFFRLMAGSDEIFYKDSDYAGMDANNMKSFNTYHYTVYVPTNESVRQAIADGLPTWDYVDSERERLEALLEQDLLPEDFVIEEYLDSIGAIITHFVQYHIQDNSVFVGGGRRSGEFETSAMNLEDMYFYRLKVNADNDAVTIVSLDGETRHVVTDDPDLYNILVSDYKFNAGDITKATQIETSSFAVIHQIDGVLKYE